MRNSTAIPESHDNKSGEEESNLSWSEKIGKWDVSKANLLWIFGIFGIILFSLFIFSCFKGDSDWTGNLIGAVGGLASIFGIYLNLCQTIETKKDMLLVSAIAEATRNATEDTRKTLKKTMSVAQVAKYCEQIKLIQEYFDNQELKIVIALLPELQEAVIELRSYLKSINAEFDEQSISAHIIKMGMNITFLRNTVEQKKDKYKRDEIRKDFQELHNTMLELKALLTTHENERP